MINNIVLVKSPKNSGVEVSEVVVLTNKAMKLKSLSDCEVSVVFVGRKRARDLNIKYRQKSYIPQVLGFPMSREKDVDGIIRLGDIVICTQKLKYEAVFMGKDQKVILEQWLLHGLENLLI
ncbi:rRNA maturation RNase YbeY [Candidatus Shapirobacteria bacterium]|nr:rRNA maturation RNase YbeY [Candidatus Shapirobacteria bacterium]